MARSRYGRGSIRDTIPMPQPSRSAPYTNPLGINYGQITAPSLANQGNPLAHSKNQATPRQVADTLLSGLLGTDTAHVAYAVQHPIGRLENKGPYRTREYRHGLPANFSGKQIAADMPPMFGGFGFLKGVGAKEAAASAEVIKQAAREKALAEGYGPRGVGNAPRVPKGTTTPETGGALGQQVRDVLAGKPEPMGAYEKAGAQLDNPHLGKSAASLRGEQKAAQRAERSARVARSQQAYEAAGGGTAGHAAAMAELKGAYPTIPWRNSLVNLDSHTMDDMVRFINDHPSFQPFEKRRAVIALQKITEGKLPQANEERLLVRAFGKETAGALRDTVASGDWKKLTADVLNVPRAMMASMDLSAPMRQGLVAGVTHPSLLARNLAPMLKMAKSEDFYQAAMDVIHADADFPLAHKAGVAFTDIGKTAGGAARLNMREEQRMSNLAEQIPGIGRVIRSSDRAYVGFLNKMRMDYFKRLIDHAARAGKDINDEKFLQGVAKIINDATGRGAIPDVMQEHLASMNALFFAPRLLASRVNVLFNPFKFRTLDSFARKEALRQLASMGAFAITVGGLAKMAGASVNLDPRNADFMKARVGNSRFDFLGGFQQVIRLGAQIYTGQIVSSTTGNLLPLGHGFGQKSRLSVLAQFLRGKLSPIPSLVVDALAGENMIGQRVTWNDLPSMGREAAQHMVPFLAQDIYDLWTTPDIPTGVKIGAPFADVFGVGNQAYAPKESSSGRGNAPAGYGRRGRSGSSYGRGHGTGSRYGRRP